MIKQFYSTHRWYPNTPSQIGFGSEEKEGVLHIPQSSRIGALPSDSLVSYPEYSLKCSYPHVEMQSAYSTAPADSTVIFNNIFYLMNKNRLLLFAF